MSDIIVGYKSQFPPQYSTHGSAGCDLIANDEVTLPPGKWAAVSTGLYLEIPRGFVAQVCPRSGLALNHGISVLNAPGIVDCFSGESLISALSGKKNVHDLKINEAILSFNEETQEIEKDIVTAIVDVGVKNVIVFTFEDENSISVTPGTLIYTLEGLKEAKDITTDDQILFNHDI